MSIFSRYAKFNGSQFDTGHSSLDETGFPVVANRATLAWNHIPKAKKQNRV
jgi:hypothetical protein